MPKKKTFKPFLLPRKAGLYLKMTKTKGRGVFCTTSLRKGELIEATPALPLTEKHTREVEKTLLCEYVFVLGDISKRLRSKLGIRKPEMASCALFGLMTFCNHDEKPNAEIRWEEHDGTLYHVLRTTRQIPAHTEICTTYGEGWFDEPHRR